jgi:hypothetical protein
MKTKMTTITNPVREVRFPPLERFFREAIGGSQSTRGRQYAVVLDQLMEQYTTPELRRLEAMGQSLIMKLQQVDDLFELLQDLEWAAKEENKVVMRTLSILILYYKEKSENRFFYA